MSISAMSIRNMSIRNMSARNATARNVLLAAALCGSAMAVHAEPVVNNNITEAEVRQAQQAWGDALVQISQDHAEHGVEKATETARAVLDAAYGYNMGPVLFKPTLASGETTFRTTYEGALSYFVAGNPQFDDGGFALKGWESYDFENAAVYINGDLALTMGHVMVTDGAGDVTTVDKTWGFKKDESGAVRIVLHHSSLPYSD